MAKKRCLAARLWVEMQVHAHAILCRHQRYRFFLWVRQYRREKATRPPDPKLRSFEKDSALFRKAKALIRVEAGLHHVINAWVASDWQRYTVGGNLSMATAWQQQRQRPQRSIGLLRFQPRRLKKLFCIWAFEREKMDSPDHYFFRCRNPRRKFSPLPPKLGTPSQHQAFQSARRFRWIFPSRIPGKVPRIFFWQQGRVVYRV